MDAETKADFAVLGIVVCAPLILIAMTLVMKGVLWTIKGVTFAANHGHATITLVGGTLLIVWITNLLTPTVGSMGEIDE